VRARARLAAFHEAGFILLGRELNRVIAFGQSQLDPDSIDPATFGLLEADLYMPASRSTKVECLS
jgi:hypothetical protein